ncbi:helix-turn-helix domain-containing protein [Algibacillus agarilyticus]|uniref:helix-turn-helix domain-containing protein n=1 Tax=Algibacillus agarilyticus TaxID=2234133 RepID=UPI000DCF978A|nr:AraC family transcriptional regulator [Algibacillus agarilyticus]
MILPEKFETGSGGFVWQNILTDSILSSLRLHVYYAYFMQTNAQWSGSQFVNHYNRLYFVTEGEAVLCFKDHELIMKPGYLYLIPPYSLNSHYCDKKLNFYWIHFHALIEGDLDLFSLFGQPQALKVDDFSLTCDAFDNIVKSANTETSLINSPTALLERNMNLTHLLLPFIDKMMSNNQEAQHSGYLRFLPILKYIQNHLHENILIKSLAAELDLSIEHFSRLFKQELNISPKRYILQKRMALAKQLLLLDSIPVSDVAQRTGFADVYHFSKIFKQEVGVAPSYYRNQFKR